jgi:hypothetical protein
VLIRLLENWACFLEAGTISFHQRAAVRGVCRNGGRNLGCIFQAGMTPDGGAVCLASMRDVPAAFVLEQ